MKLEANIITTDDSHEFHLMRLADSFFPSGTFGTSGGLEALAKSGRVNDSDGVADFIRQQIELRLAPCDCRILLAVMDAARADDLPSAVAADNLCNAMKLAREVRTASTRSGRQLLNSVLHSASNPFARKFSRSIDAGKSPGTYSACLAVAAFSFKIPNNSAVRMMLYSYSAGICGSAIRLGLISHIDSQDILTGLAEYVENVQAKPGLDDLWQLGPLVEILQMQHERDELRMFIT
ncbi:MAG TPA: urease accessory UreF family protein [Nitrososphaera sp.]|nr:urease accessory UreF family protein [Nitrososphaera sp.]